MKKNHLASVAGLAGVAVAALMILSPSAPLVAHGETDETIYTVEGDVQKPVRLSGDAPVYPEEARKERIQGRAIVRAVIDRDGTVTSTEVVETEHEDLGVAAAEAIRTWTFEPATLEGEPVPVYYHLTVKFRLDGEDAKEPEDQEPSLR